jgi:hypothetical protein
VHDDGLLTGVPPTPHEPALLLKPEPKTFTSVPTDPEAGDRAIVALTLNAALAESRSGPVTFTKYPPGAYSDPVPTLNFAVSTPPLVTVHAGSPVVSMFNPAVVAAIVHPVPGPLKPVPVAVTSVAGVTVPAAGEPLVGLRVSLGPTVKLAAFE